MHYYAGSSFFRSTRNFILEVQFHHEDGLRRRQYFELFSCIDPYCYYNNTPPSAKLGLCRSTIYSKFLIAHQIFHWRPLWSQNFHCTPFLPGWWWSWRFWWSITTRLLESSRSRLTLRPRQKWCEMENLENLTSKGPPMKNLVCNEKFGINCASAEAQFGTGRGISFQIIHLQITIWAKF